MTPDRVRARLTRVLQGQFWSVLIASLVMACANARNDDGEPPSRRDASVAVVDGRVSLYLSEGAQARIDLDIEAAEARVFFPENHGYGRVVDISELVRLRAEHSRKQVELAALKIENETRRAGVERLQSMHDEGALVSFEQLYEARRDLQQGRTRASVLQAELDAIRMVALQQWGPELGGLVADAEPPLLDDLVQRRKFLVIAGLGPGKRLEPDAPTLYVAADGNRVQATEARVLGPAPYGSALQGETHYLVTAAPNLRVGMRVDLWVPQSARTERGVTVPKSAVVWYGGRRWVYVRRGGDRFERQQLEHTSSLGGELFVGEGIEPGEEIVVRGGQALLAEEFRWSIPDEDDDE